MDYAYAFSPFKKASIAKDQIRFYNNLKLQQTDQEIGYWCGSKTARISQKIGKLPLFKQLNNIAKFGEKIYDKIVQFRIKHNI